MTPHRNLLLAAAILAASAPALLGAQTQSPATRRAHEIVALINTATPAAIRAYVDTAFAARMRQMPMSAHMSFMMGQRERSQGLEWVEVQDEAPGRTTAL